MATLKIFALMKQHCGKYWVDWMHWWQFTGMTRNYESFFTWMKFNDNSQVWGNA